MDNMTRDSFAVHGTFVYSRDSKELVSYEDAYLVCIHGRSEGIF